jgi:cyclophilin family peptidyl-prolyl cis-trans isomerase
MRTKESKPSAAISDTEGHLPERFSDSEEALAFFKGYARANHPVRYRIETRFGSIDIELFQNTPLHKANFNYLAEKHYFNDTWFYRVSEGHVIQAGNTDALRTIKKRKAIGEYRVPAEMENGNLHTYGAVAAARSYAQNPDKESDPYEFYIVLGKKYSKAQLQAMSTEYGFDLSPEKIKAYAEMGGAPHLDGEHTVFGRVVSGMEVVEEIARQQTDEGEWPLLNIPIKVQALP